MGAGTYSRRALEALCSVALSRTWSPSHCMAEESLRRQRGLGPACLLRFYECVKNRQRNDVQTLNGNGEELTRKNRGVKFIGK